MTSGQRVVVVGAGVFGAAAALTLRRRGHQVTVVDPGPIPHPAAASTDISKAVRMEYGADALYSGLMEGALEGWREWNASWPTPPFHETGVMFLSRVPLAAGSFEQESLRVLEQRGHRVERVRSADIRARFPAWDADRYVDGIHNPVGGYARSGLVVRRLWELARAAGAELLEGARVTALVESSGRVSGVATDRGARVDAEWVVLATGAWALDLAPELASFVRSVGQPVFHLAPPDPALFEAKRFPVFGADISQTGYYGFPLRADDAGRAVVKIANHGVGRAFGPDDPQRVVRPEDERALRAHLRTTFPSLVQAPIVTTRVCMYCDTADGDFLLDHHPARPGLFVATGGSGHAFKFAPRLGEWIADALEGRGSPTPRFGWRTEPNQGAREQARSTR